MTLEEFDAWLREQPYDNMIVYLKYKYSNERDWTYSKEILLLDSTVPYFYVWENDWYEGQQNIEVLGCIAVSDVEVPEFDVKSEKEG